MKHLFLAIIILVVATALWLFERGQKHNLKHAEFKPGSVMSLSIGNNALNVLPQSDTINTSGSRLIQKNADKSETLPSIKTTAVQTNIESMNQNNLFNNKIFESEFGQYAELSSNKTVTLTDHTGKIIWTVNIAKVVGSSRIHSFGFFGDNVELSCSGKKTVFISKGSGKLGYTVE